MADLFFTADTHYGYEAVIRHSVRPFGSVEEMNEALVCNWNETVGPNDEVWHLGDIALRAPDAGEFLERVHGRIHLCLGNHDSASKMRGYAAAGLLASVQHVRYLRHEGERFWLSHYCHRVWQNSHKGSIHLFGHSHGDIIVRGGRLMDVGVDAAARWLRFGGNTGIVYEVDGEPVPDGNRPEDYRPLSFDEVTGYLAGDPPTNHHTRRLILAEGG